MVFVIQWENMSRGSVDAAHLYVLYLRGCVLVSKKKKKRKRHDHSWRAWQLMNRGWLSNSLQIDCCWFLCNLCTCFNLIRSTRMRCHILDKHPIQNKCRWLIGNAQSNIFDVRQHYLLVKPPMLLIQLRCKRWSSFSPHLVHRSHLIWLFWGHINLLIQVTNLFPWFFSMFKSSSP